MERTIVIETFPWETRAAILEDQKLVEVFLEAGGSPLGNIYKARVEKVIPGLSCAFLDLGEGKMGFLMLSSRPKGQEPFLGTIKKGQEILVQVRKEEGRGKGPKVTTSLSIPGHFLVLLPFSDDIFISRQITDTARRSELQKWLRDVKPDGVGVILRTAAASAALEEIAEELQALMITWNMVRKQALSLPTPSLVYQEANLVPKVLRDYLDDHTGLIIVNSDEMEKEVKGIVRRDARQREVMIRKVDNPFYYLGLEKELKNMVSTKVWLNSGGYLVIEETEAMTVIDVNTGKFLGKKEFQETALQTNLEAAREIPRQLRLRAIGGIILVDFIDMAEPEAYELLLEVMNREFQYDKERPQVHGVTKLGLVEITRKKSRLSLHDYFYRACSSCGGRGLSLNRDAVVRELMRDLIKLDNRQKEVIEVMVNTELMPQIQRARPYFDYISSHLKKEIVLEYCTETEYYVIRP